MRGGGRLGSKKLGELGGGYYRLSGNWYLASVIREHQTKNNKHQTKNIK